MCALSWLITKLILRCTVIKTSKLGLYILLVTLLALRIMRWLQDFRRVCMYRTGSP